MEIFKLFGTILIDNTRANQQLDETDTKAQKVGRTLGSMVTTAAKWGAGITAAATAAGAALFALTSKVAANADALSVNAQRAGITTRAFQEMRYALTQVGIAESDVSMTLQRLNQRVGEAEEGSSKYAQALQRLGVSTRNANGEIKASDELFMELVTRLHQVEDAQLRAALGGEIFGVNLAQRLLPAIEAGGKALADLRNRAHQVGAVLDEGSVEAGARFANALNELRDVSGRVVNQIGIRLIPIFERFVAFAVENLPKIGPVFEFIAEVIEIVIRHTSRALEPWVTLIKSILGVGWEWTVKLVGDAWEWLTTTTWAEKWEHIKGWLTSGWNWTINILGKAWDWLTETSWSEKIDDIRGWLASAWSWTVNLVGKLWDWLDEKAPWATETIRTIRDWLSKAWDWAINLAGEFWAWLDEKAPWLTSTLETVWNWIQKGWDWTLNFVGDAWDWLKDTAWPWLKGTAATTWDWTFNLLGDAASWIRDVAWPWLSRSASTAWTWAVDLLGEFAVWLKDMAWPWLSKSASTAWTWTLALAGDAAAWIKDVAWPWLSKAASTAWNWTLNLLGDAVSWIKDTAWPWLSQTASTAWSWSVDLAGDAIRWVKDIAWPVIVGGAQSAWGFTLNLVGEAWSWLRDVAWPVLSQGVSLAWDWTVDAAGAAWDWIANDGWQDTLEAIQNGFAGLPGAISAYVSDAVEIVRYWLGERLESAVWLVTSTVLRIANFFSALRDGLIRRATDMVTGVLQWFTDLKDQGLASIQAMSEGIQEWWGETKLGKTFNWMGEQIEKVGNWFFNLYDRVVGHSYIPDMVEEIGQAIARLREKLANPVVRYTMQSLEAFEMLSDGAAQAALSIADAFDRALSTVATNVGNWITDLTATFVNGTATWAGVFQSFAGLIGSTMRTLFNTLAVEFAKNLITQNAWITQTLANVATTVSALITQAYATLVAFYAWSGPLAPVLAAGTIAAAIAAIAAIGGEAIRAIFPGLGGAGAGPGLPEDPGGSSGGGARAGRQVSAITGPTRDLLTDLLSPLANLGTLTGIGERIYNLLNERLPAPSAWWAGDGLALAGAGSINITIESGAVQVVRTGPGDRDVDGSTIEEIARRLAELLTFQLRGAGQNG